MTDFFIAVKRRVAAEHLAQLLSLALVGGLLDDVGDPPARDLAGKLLARLREIIDDAREMEKTL